MLFLLSSPMAVRAVAEVAFPERAESTPLPAGTDIVSSALVRGKLGDDARYFHASGAGMAISIASAERQAPRVAAARQLPVAAVRRLLAQDVVDGARPRSVNVLGLNLALGS
jgi:K+-transporting ATPase c subunit